MTKPEFDVHHLAELARIELTSEEEATFARQLGSVLEYVDQLAELNVDEVPETAQVTGLTDVFQDSVQPIDDDSLRVRRDTYVAAAPEHDAGFIKIPAIFGESE